MERAVRTQSAHARHRDRSDADGRGAGGSGGTPHLGRGERNTQLQTQLIDEMLDVSRIITGQLRLDVTPIDVVAVVRAALDSVRAAADAKRLRIDFASRSDVEIVLGDAARLQQVVWNLLSNAVKFTPAGGRIEVRLEPAETQIRLVVADTGEGIPANFLPYVFDRFRQGEGGPGRRHGGLGLGLAIVRHVVELHGGRVQVESSGISQGATFSVSLPRRGGQQFAALAAESAVARIGTSNVPVSLDGVRILVVDDDLDTREALTACLELSGAKVTSVDTTSAALLALPRDRPDVIVSDIAMPGRDGYALIAAVRQLPERAGGRTRAIAVTGYASAHDEAQVRRAGYDLHLAKPVDPEMLTAAIARVMRGEM